MNLCQVMAIVSNCMAQSLKELFFRQSEHEDYVN